MKTFDEAVDAVAFEYKGQAELAVASQKTQEIIARYQALADEAQKNGKVISVLLLFSQQGNDEDALFTLFMFGLSIGVEMEKANDLPQSHKVADVPLTLHDILPANWETMSVAQQRDFMIAKADDFRAERDFLERGMRKLHQISLEAAKT